MDAEEFRTHGKSMIDYIVNYKSNVQDHYVYPDVVPGFLRPQLPDHAPEHGEKFDDIMKDIDKKVVPGLLHWCHPHFFAFFPSGNSYPSILGDMLSAAFNPIGFSWASCPSLTELEGVVVDWWAKALGLPSKFLSKQAEPSSNGGGCLHGSASEAIYTSIMAARFAAIKHLKELSENTHVKHDSEYLPRLVAYTSTEAHSCVEKGCHMAMVKHRILKPDETGALRGKDLEKAIQEDVEDGLTPFYVCATVGTTGGCFFDKIREIGEVCKKYKTIWYHVDGAYGGCSFVCPENRKFMDGIELVDSINTNANKFMLTNFDCSALWASDIKRLCEGFVIDPVYLQHENENQAIDYRHYGIPLSRRLRALKLFFLFRVYGTEGLQKYVRNHMKLAKEFEKMVRSDERFEIMNEVNLGLVGFRLKRSDCLNQRFIAKLNETRQVHLTPSVLHGKFAIRFCVTYEHAEPKHIEFGWNLIKKCADEIWDEPDEKLTEPASEDGEAAPKRMKHDDNLYHRMAYLLKHPTTQRLSDFAVPVVHHHTDKSK